MYAEQLSGSPFTAPRKDNMRSWLYRSRPSVAHEPFENLAQQGHPAVMHAEDANSAVTPNQLRWLPSEAAGAEVDFVHGLTPMCGSGRSVAFPHSHVYNMGHGSFSQSAP